MSNKVVIDALDIAFQIYVKSQVSLADPEFWHAHEDMLARTKLDVDKMTFDLEVYMPKLMELRKAGKIASVLDARAAAARIVAQVNEVTTLSDLASRIAKQDYDQLNSGKLLSATDQLT